MASCRRHEHECESPHSSRVRWHMAIIGIGDVRAELMALGALLILASAVPYLLDITRGRTRPLIFSWIVWTLLGAIATVAAYTEGEYPSAALTAAASVETGSIVALGWTYGIREFRTSRHLLPSGRDHRSGPVGRLP